MKALDLTGQVFGKLTVVRKARSIRDSSGIRRTRWLVRCECGKERPLSTNHLQTMNTKSCGCAQHRRLPPGQAIRNYILVQYKFRAKQKGLTWALTDEQFDNLTKATCHYCGVVPFNVRRNKHLRGEFTYNGIDRKDSSRGYTTGNVVPCCKVCQFMKRDLPYSEFLLHVRKIASYTGEACS